MSAGCFDAVKCTFYESDLVPSAGPYTLVQRRPRFGQVVKDSLCPLLATFQTEAAYGAAFRNSATLQYVLRSLLLSMDTIIWLTRSEGVSQLVSCT